MSASESPRLSPEYEHDPVAAYDRLAPHYAELSRRREAYLRAIDNCIIARIPKGATSLLDVGAGDGSRAVRIAGTASIERIVLLEPSSEMSRLASDSPAQNRSGAEWATSAMSKLSTARAELWPTRAEALDASSITERFDVITCLWNVLGHVSDAQRRIRVLKTAAQLLSQKGSLFLDVIHRYNLRSYGPLATGVRWLKDQLITSERNGDVVAIWTVGRSQISTYGHVFTHREIMLLGKSAGLQPEKRLVIDYETGKSRRFTCQGNLLYVFRRSS